MAKQKAAVVEEVSLASEGAPRPRLHKLIIRNFRSIGPHLLRSSLMILLYLSVQIMLVKVVF